MNNLIKQLLKHRIEIVSIQLEISKNQLKNLNLETEQRTQNVLRNYMSMCQDEEMNARFKDTMKRLADTLESMREKMEKKG